MTGNTYHHDKEGNYLPILPRVPADSPHLKPKFSVVDPPKEDVRNVTNYENQEDEEGATNFSNPTLAVF